MLHRYKICLKNVGRSPAIKAGIFLELVPTDLIVDRQMRDVAAMTIEPVSFGSTLFPGGTKEMASTFSIKGGTIEDAVAHMAVT